LVHDLSDLGCEQVFDAFRRCTDRAPSVQQTVRSIRCDVVTRSGVNVISPRSGRSEGEDR
jgi:hypothetical protein